ncbi:hypothetical protein PHLGIDRAFT_34724 [Phlebiopsis gigantea 11061_1 CR5-6]|uniref:Uncharacterized protein n=1 Tax=Phlebiopsis gigantea (strain 11061_1 CR5-6) TaxID=745531 RepID=A0A0C3S1H1_PHLG1|nr:hypothetical protein PHLGIDRAFT_34724 [Phlebiopsis gigantea 11061_1 CR5-6]
MPVERAQKTTKGLPRVADVARSSAKIEPGRITSRDKTVPSGPQPWRAQLRTARRGGAALRMSNGLVRHRGGRCILRGTPPVGDITREPTEKMLPNCPRAVSHQEVASLLNAAYYQRNRRLPPIASFARLRLVDALDMPENRDMRSSPCDPGGVARAQARKQRKCERTTVRLGCTYHRLRTAISRLGVYATSHASHVRTSTAFDRPKRKHWRHGAARFGAHTSAGRPCGQRTRRPSQLPLLSDLRSHARGLSQKQGGAARPHTGSAEVAPSAQTRRHSQDAAITFGSDHDRASRRWLARYTLARVANGCPWLSTHSLQPIRQPHWAVPPAGIVSPSQTAPPPPANHGCTGAFFARRRVGTSGVAVAAARYPRHTPRGRCLEVRFLQPSSTSESGQVRTIETAAGRTREGRILEGSVPQGLSYGIAGVVVGQREHLRARGAPTTGWPRWLKSVGGLRVGRAWHGSDHHSRISHFPSRLRASGSSDTQMDSGCLSIRRYTLLYESPEGNKAIDAEGGLTFALGSPLSQSLLPAPMNPEAFPCLSKPTALRAVPCANEARPETLHRIERLSSIWSSMQRQNRESKYCHGVEALGQQEVVITACMHR